MRDSQRQRSYDWERSTIASLRGWTANNLITEFEIDKLLTKLAKHCAIPKPSVRFSSRNGASALGSKITIGRVMMKEWVVIHEFAHIVTDHYFSYHKTREFHAAHGKEFMSVYLYLASYYFKVNWGLLKRSAKAYRLKVASISKIWEEAAHRRVLIRVQNIMDSRLTKWAATEDKKNKIQSTEL